MLDSGFFMDNCKTYSLYGLGCIDVNFGEVREIALDDFIKL